MRKEEMINGLRTLRGELANNYKDNQRIGFIAGVNRAIEFIHSTDEPEVLSQEWVDENEVFIFDLDDGCEIRYVPSLKLRHLISPNGLIEVKIQELIERYRNEDGKYSNPENAWIGGFIEDLENLLEEEQKYYIRDQHGVYLLAKNHSEQGNVQTVAEIVEYYGVEEIELGYELTEQEIKDYDPRYMTFAKPIEELEE